MFGDLRLAIFYFEMDYLQAYVTRVLLFLFIQPHEIQRVFLSVRGSRG